MKYKRFLVFAWNLSECGSIGDTGSPFNKIKESFNSQKDAEKKAAKLSDLDDDEFHDFVSIFDCKKKEVILELDNIPF